MSDMFSVKGKRVLITGGTKGIGGAIARQLLVGGASVIVNYVRDKKSADAFIAENSAFEDNITVCRADLSRDTGIEKLMEAVGDDPIDHFIHSAATGVHKPLNELTMRHWDWTMSLNLRAFFELVTRLRQSFVNGGSIIAMSSEGAQRAAPNYALVGASKGGLESLCRHLSLELAADNIRVNVISAGSVLTQAWDAFPDKDERVSKVKKKLPGGEMLKAAEVASVASFLCTDASSAINAHTLVVDKGERIFS